MASSPQKRKQAVKKAAKPTVMKTDDEVMAKLFGKDVRESLKKLARDSRRKNRGTTHT